MRYAGSKSKFANELVPIICKNMTDEKIYIEPFCGGCNMMSNVPSKNKIGSDINVYVIKMWKQLQSGWIPPMDVSEDEYYRLKRMYQSKNIYDDETMALIGYVGNACSNGSAWFNGYAHFNPKRNENHIKEAYRGTLRQLKKFNNFSETTFISENYDSIDYPSPEKCVIYCDPPYAQTKSYINSFDSEKFWKWVKKMHDKGYEIYVSEYKAPKFAKCIWEKQKKDGMKNTKDNGKQPVKTEKLFRL